ncbi:MAG: M67 family metallopeptidase [Candidatus Nezhaarchaeota archaeon]|nr:M67 family metallopeptidase [Candidatus Nezhaarchaeota archaeon]
MRAVRGLIVREEDLKKLAEAALKSKAELCGFLIGLVNGGEAVVELLEPLENVSPSPLRFEAKPEDVYRAYFKAEELGLEVVGIYHSHPAPPRPSLLDVEGMRRWPLVWLIVSSLDGSAAAFQLVEGEVREVSLATSRRAS